MFRKENKYGDAKIHLLTVEGSWGDSVSSGCQEEYGPKELRSKFICYLTPNTCSCHWPFLGQISLKA